MLFAFLYGIIFIYIVCGDNMDNDRQNLKELYKIRKSELKEDYKKQKQDIKQEVKDFKEASMTNIKGRVKNNMSGFLRAVVSGLLVLVQILVILTLPLFLRQYTAFFYFILEVASFVVAIGLINANKNASFKVAWMAIALLFPVSGHIMYYLWGRRSSRKKLFENTELKIAESYPYIEFDAECEKDFYSEHPELKGLSKYLKSYRFPLYRNNRAKYYRMGEDVFKDIFQDIIAAKKFVLLNFFIVADGVLLDMLHDILLKKVKEGVEVIFIYDDFGGMIRTDKHFCRKLNDEGIRTILFNPIHKYTDKLIMNYRTHQKIVVIDGNIGYTGGFNIADEYANLIERFGVWKDCGIRIEGDGVWGLTMIFLQVLSICRPKENVDYNRYRPDKIPGKNNCYCHVIADGPYPYDSHIMESTYKQIISSADEYVYIMTPYLILEEHMIQTLTEAVKRGVDVRIITPKIPDKKKVYKLTQYNYGPLLGGGVRIYEYTPGFIHSKVIMNESSALVGTVNMDYRSFYLHFENAVWISEKEILADIYDDFENTFMISETISYESWKNRPRMDKIIQPVLNMFSTLV